MLARWQFATLTVIAMLAVALAIVDIALHATNRTAQAEVAARTQYLQQTVQLQGLHQEIAKALAELAVRNQDPALRELLEKQGLARAPQATLAPTPAPLPRK